MLWVGESADPAGVAAVAERIGGALEPSPAGLLAIRKTPPDAGGLPAPRRRRARSARSPEPERRLSRVRRPG